MLNQLMNWDDLRIIAAVRDEGTYAGASTRLRIDETTVARRLARIQRTLGVTLFEAVDGVRKPTAGPVVCCYPGDLDLTPESQFLAAKGLQGRARCVTDNIRIIRALIETQAAVGILPQYICEDLLDNDRLRATPLPKRRDVWLLVQNHFM